MRANNVVVVCDSIAVQQRIVDQGREADVGGLCRHCAQRHLVARQASSAADGHGTLHDGDVVLDGPGEKEKEEEKKTLLVERRLVTNVLAAPFTHAHRTASTKNGRPTMALLCRLWALARTLCCGANGHCRCCRCRC